MQRMLAGMQRRDGAMLRNQMKKGKKHRAGLGGSKLTIGVNLPKVADSITNLKELEDVEKYQNPIEAEASLMTFAPQDADRHARVMLELERMARGHDGQGLRPRAQALLVDLKLKDAIHAYDNNYARDFWAWTMGRSRHNDDLRLTPWGRKDLLHIPGIRERIDMFVKKRMEFQQALVLLWARGQQGFLRTLEEAWLYYKYIVTGWNKWYQANKLVIAGNRGGNGSPPPFLTYYGMIDFLDEYRVVNDLIDHNPDDIMVHGAATFDPDTTMRLDPFGSPLLDAISAHHLAQNDDSIIQQADPTTDLKLYCALVQAHYVDNTADIDRQLAQGEKARIAMYQIAHLLHTNRITPAQLADNRLYKWLVSYRAKNAETYNDPTAANVIAGVGPALNNLAGAVHNGVVNGMNAANAQLNANFANLIGAVQANGPQAVVAQIQAQTAALTVQLQQLDGLQANSQLVLRRILHELQRRGGGGAAAAPPAPPPPPPAPPAAPAAPAAPPAAPGADGGPPPGGDGGGDGARWWQFWRRGGDGGGGGHGGGGDDDDAPGDGGGGEPYADAPALNDDAALDTAIREAAELQAVIERQRVKLEEQQHYINLVQYWDKRYKHYLGLGSNSMDATRSANADTRNYVQSLVNQRRMAQESSQVFLDTLRNSDAMLSDIKEELKLHQDIARATSQEAADSKAQVQIVNDDCRRIRFQCDRLRNDYEEVRRILADERARNQPVVRNNDPIVFPDGDEYNREEARALALRVTRQTVQREMANTQAQLHEAEQELEILQSAMGATSTSSAATRNLEAARAAIGPPVAALLPPTAPPPPPRTQEPDNDPFAMGDIGRLLPDIDPRTERPTGTATRARPSQQPMLPPVHQPRRQSGRSQGLPPENTNVGDPPRLLTRASIRRQRANQQIQQEPVAPPAPEPAPAPEQPAVDDVPEVVAAEPAAPAPSQTPAATLLAAMMERLHAPLAILGNRRAIVDESTTAMTGYNTTTANNPVTALLPPQMERGNTARTAVSRFNYLASTVVPRVRQYIVAQDQIGSEVQQLDMDHQRSRELVQNLMTENDREVVGAAIRQASLVSQRMRKMNNENNPFVSANTARHGQAFATIHNTLALHQSAVDQLQNDGSTDTRGYTNNTLPVYMHYLRDFLASSLDRDFSRDFYGAFEVVRSAVQTGIVQKMNHALSPATLQTVVDSTEQIAMTQRVILGIATNIATGNGDQAGNVNRLNQAVTRLEQLVTNYGTALRRVNAESTAAGARERLADIPNSAIYDPRITDGATFLRSFIHKLPRSMTGPAKEAEIRAAFHYLTHGFNFEFNTGDPDQTIRAMLDLEPDAAVRLALSRFTVLNNMVPRALEETQGGLDDVIQALHAGADVARARRSSVDVEQEQTQTVVYSFNGVMEGHLPMFSGPDADAQRVAFDLAITQGTRLLLPYKHDIASTPEAVQQQVIHAIGNAYAEFDRTNLDADEARARITMYNRQADNPISLYQKLFAEGRLYSLAGVAEVNNSSQEHTAKRLRTSTDSESKGVSTTTPPEEYTESYNYLLSRVARLLEDQPTRGASVPWTKERIAKWATKAEKVLKRYTEFTKRKDMHMSNEDLQALMGSITNLRAVYNSNTTRKR